MRSDHPAAVCPVDGWRVPADSAAACDDIAVVYDRRTDQIVIHGQRLGKLHSCPAAGLPRGANGVPLADYRMVAASKARLRYNIRWWLHLLLLIVLAAAIGTALMVVLLRWWLFSAR